MDETIFTNGFRFFLISSIVTIVIALTINTIARILINRFNHKYQDKITTNQYLFRTIQALVWVVSLLIIMRQIEPLHALGSTLLGATSIIAIAVGIAAQATFGNYVAGFFLAIHQPFKVGDIIRIKEKGLSGTVEQITFRHTVLKTQEHTEIIIPNTVMNTAIVEDMSNGNYSDLIEFKVSKETDLDKLQELVLGLLDKETLLHHDEDYKLIIKDITKEGYAVAFPIYTNSLQEFGSIRNSLLPKLYQQLQENNIQLV